MAKKFVTIDLQQKQSGGDVDLFINWALTIGRLLVIITEIIALGAFLYRFYLDRQVIDLQTKIKNDQAIVIYQQANEKNYINLQNRLSLASSLMNSSQKRTKIFQDVIGLAPSGLTFNTVILFPDRIQIDTTLNSVVALSVFVNALKSYPAVDSVSINNIENKTANAVINANITANLKAEDIINATSN